MVFEEPQMVQPKDPNEVSDLQTYHGEPERSVEVTLKPADPGHPTYVHDLDRGCGVAHAEPVTPSSPEPGTAGSSDARRELRSHLERAAFARIAATRKGVKPSPCRSMLAAKRGSAS